MFVLFCFTGTGVSIAANKVLGVRAALCTDGPTAGGARRWNDANVLVLSLNSTTRDKATEILDYWFTATDGDGEDRELLLLLDQMERIHASDSDMEAGKCPSSQ